MNIFGKVTLRNLQKNKTRTIVTIIGIILSTSMFTAVTSTISSVQKYLTDYSIYSDGAWYGAGFSLTPEEAEDLSSSEEIANSVSLGNIGYAYLEDSINEYKPYLFVGAMDENFASHMPVHLIEGRLPENSTEIILPNHLEKNGGISHELGEVLSLSIGTRSWESDFLNNHMSLYVSEDGSVKKEISSDGSTIRIGAETWTKSFDTTYTVVGFYERPSFEDYSAPGYTGLTLQDKSLSSYDVYYTTTSGYNAVPFTEKQSFYPDSGELNIELLRLYGYSGENTYNQVLYGLAAILIGIIMFGSISLIYNSFSISINERTKQFGILSSIGATKKQLLHSVLYEGFYLGFAGIPLGIFSGLFGMGVTFHFVGDSISDLFYGITEVRLGLHPSIGALIIAGVISFFTILLSAYLPARKALKQPAIDAIRQNNDIKLSSRKVRTNPLFFKLFGFEGMIAVKNYKRSRKKYRATVFSLFISVVLFITASSFCEYLTRSVGVVYEDISYDVSLSYYGSPDLSQDTKAYFDGLKSCNQITESSYSLLLNLPVFVEKDNLTKEALEQWRCGSYGTLEETPDLLPYDFRFVFVEDEKFDEILTANGLDTKTYHNLEHPAPLLFNEQSGWVTDEERYHVYSVLSSPKESTLRIQKSLEHEEITDPNFSWENREFTEISCYSSIKKLPELVYKTNYFPCLYFPYSSLGQVLSIFLENNRFDTIASYCSTEFFAKSNNPEESIASLREYKENALSKESVFAEYGYSLMNYAAELEMQRATLFIIRVFSYGFIVLISLISVANVFNTISTNVILRRKEFAMLRSVGMTPKGFLRMMNFECLLYGIKGLLYGLPVSIGLTFLIYMVISNGVSMNFFIPASSILIAVGSVFLVVFATMIYSMKKLSSENTVEALKNENI